MKYIIPLLSYLPDIIFGIITLIYRKHTNSDIHWLRKNYFLNINGWKIGHFLSYMIKGLLFNKKYILFFVLIGFLFEIFEYYTTIENIDSDIIGDTITNTLGYIFGIFIAKYLIKM